MSRRDAQGDRCAKCGGPRAGHPTPEEWTSVHLIDRCDTFVSDALIEGRKRLTGQGVSISAAGPLLDRLNETRANAKSWEGQCEDARALALEMGTQRDEARAALAEMKAERDEVRCLSDGRQRQLKTAQLACEQLEASLAAMRAELDRSQSAIRFALDEDTRWCDVKPVLRAALQPERTTP